MEVTVVSVEGHWARLGLLDWTAGVRRHAQEDSALSRAQRKALRLFSIPGYVFIFFLSYLGLLFLYFAVWVMVDSEEHGLSIANLVGLDQFRFSPVTTFMEIGGNSTR